MSPFRMLGATVLATLLAGPAGAQGWFSDRADNAIVNADQIAARFREQVQGELERIGRRPAVPPPPTRTEQQALRETERWWQRPVEGPTGEPGTPIRVSLAFLYDSALINAAQLRVFGDLPAIRETLEREVAGRYTPRAYVEGRIEDGSDATRNLATTRGSERLLSRERGVEFGVRQRIITGGEVTVGQRFLNFSSNSTDFAPSNQSRSRSFITIVQPILRDSGVAYTRSLHEVARIDARVAQSEFRRQAESHLLDIARGYWGCTWRAPCSRRRNAAPPPCAASPGRSRAARRSMPTRCCSTASARRWALREADLLRARAAIRNAEARVRGLVNDPRFEQQGVSELLPSDRPLAVYEPILLQTVLERAVAFRPEVQQLFLQHRAAVLREGQAQIEALPRFDVVAEASLGGRAIDTGRWGDALNDATRNSDRPGGLLGLRVEVPLGRDDLRARLDRRRLETRQIESQGRATVATIVAEAEITLNEYNVAWREVGARAVAPAAGDPRPRHRERALAAGCLRRPWRGRRQRARAPAGRAGAAGGRRKSGWSAPRSRFTLAFLALQRCRAPSPACRTSRSSASTTPPAARASRCDGPPQRRTPEPQPPNARTHAMTRILPLVAAPRQPRCLRARPGPGSPLRRRDRFSDRPAAHRPGGVHPYRATAPGWSWPRPRVCPSPACCGKSASRCGAAGRAGRRAAGRRRHRPGRHHRRRRHHAELPLPPAERLRGLDGGGSGRCDGPARQVEFLF